MIPARGSYLCGDWEKYCKQNPTGNKSRLRNVPRNGLHEPRHAQGVQPPAWIV
jgi:hypothetical protein